MGRKEVLNMNRKRLFSLIISFLLAVTFVIPAMTDNSYASVSIRTSMPSYTSAAGKAYYYSDNNLFYKYNLGPDRQYNRSYGGYVVGNCTWYAYGRASEILGHPLNTAFRWSASEWWNTNKKGNYYPYGSTPKVGAIACYGTHVAIVEKVVNGKPYVSESGWKVSSSKPSSASSLYFHYGTPWSSSLKGYIYILDSARRKNVDYSVKVSVNDLNMRTGPGTNYKSKGYINPGTHTVSKTSNGWGKIKSSGYWVSLNYTSKVSGSEEMLSVSSGRDLYTVRINTAALRMRTGPGTNYSSKGLVTYGSKYVIKDTKNGWGQLRTNNRWIKLSYTVPVGSEYNVKVKCSDLNMRTGPGILYKSKGFIKPGTYTIKKTKNGWGKLKKNGYWIKLSYTTKI